MNVPFFIAILAIVVTALFVRWFDRHHRPPVTGLPQGAPEPPVLADPLRLQVYMLEQAMSRSPEVTSPGELRFVPAFTALVEHLSQPEFDNAALESYVVGNRVVPAWAALHALARRPRDPAIASRALFWLNQFHPWTRELTLRMLEAWTPEDPELVGLVLSRLDVSWQGCLIVLDGFLRRRAQVASLTLGSHLLGLDSEARERLNDLLKECEPDLVQPLRAELGQVSESMRGPSNGSGRSNPLVVDIKSSGRRHEPGKLEMPDLYPRAGFETASQRLLRALQAEPHRSVLISGDPGVGKSTLARSLAATMSKAGWRVFETSAPEINAGMSFSGQLEGRVQLLLQEARGQRRTIWLVRDFHQLLWSGRTMQDPTGILDMLVPAIAADELLLIGETSAAAADLVLTERPDLARLLETVRLDPPREEELLAIARAWVNALGPSETARWPAGLLDEAVMLARHHLSSLGMPAGLIRVLERTRESAADSPTGLTPDHLIRAISDLTGLPLDLLDERQALNTSALQAHFESRVIGQPEAVRCLVERLALMKAGITAASRPYAVLLFAGPTGTGKTELVKALAAYLFGSADRMVRVDMSELQDASAFERLLAAGGVTAGGSLAARVRRQPYSVVLLDEFEKAHARIWNLFLQVFDDGRLTDTRGDTVDFRNTFIVLTSNLGARLSGGDRLGFVDGQEFSSREVERAVNTTFRPELINRLDRLVVFRPLLRDAMRSILRKQIAEAFMRRGLRRREWALEIDEGALEFLLEHGFTPDLGARPLQRSLEQHLLAPLARTIVDHRAPEGDQFLFVRRDGDRLKVEFVDPDAEHSASTAPEPGARPGSEQDLRAIAWDAQGDSRELETLTGATASLEQRLGEEAWSARKAALLAEAAAPEFWQRADRFEVLGRAEYLDRVESGVRSARSLLGRLEGESRRRKSYPRPMLRRLAQQLVLLDTACREAIEHGPRDAFVSIEPGPDAGSGPAGGAWQDRLLAMYEGWARARGMRLLRLEPVPVRGSRPVSARWIAVSGFAALSTLQPEHGLHVLEEGTPGPGTQRTTARVRVVAQPPRPARGAADISHQAATALGDGGGPLGVVRRYRESPSPLARDSVRGWRTGRIDRVWAGDFDVVPQGDESGA